MGSKNFHRWCLVVEVERTIFAIYASYAAGKDLFNPFRGWPLVWKFPLVGRFATNQRLKSSTLQVDPSKHHLLPTTS
jgi:hypothetical protein